MKIMLERLKRREKGFTLIELLIAIALGGLVVTAAATSIYQLFTGTAFSNELNIAINQVRNVGYWVNRDAQMTQPGEGDTTVLCNRNNYTDPNDGYVYPYVLVQMKQKVYQESTLFTTSDWTYTYYFTNKTGIQNLYRRSQYDPLVGTGVDETAVIAQYIDAKNTTCVYNYTSAAQHGGIPLGVINMNVTAHYHDMVKSKGYQIELRRTM